MTRMVDREKSILGGGREAKIGPRERTYGGQVQAKIACQKCQDCLSTPVFGTRGQCTDAVLRDVRD
jgi:hypothetical protein